MLTGLYHYRLTDESARTFFDDEWTVAPEADRIGYRYKNGRALQFRPREQPFGAGADPSNIVDACYPIGSIQVPAEPSRSSCTATRCRAAATRRSARSSAPTWT